jgi:hypothetical protein
MIHGFFVLALFLTICSSTSEIVFFSFSHLASVHLSPSTPSLFQWLWRICLCYPFLTTVSSPTLAIDWSS